MVSNPPKVSFIPKGSLAHEESFMERRRPRSVTGFLAIFAFVASVGSYAGFYFYANSLLKEVEKKSVSISNTQREFLKSPEINKAKVFRARAELARELLDQHIAISPIFAFLSGNTLGSILYDSFSFNRNGNTWALSLTGEAPSYASLAYQADVLRKKSTENEFLGFSINDITLTKSGTVTFAMSVDFAQSQLLYVKHSQAFEDNTPFVEMGAPTVSSEPVLPPLGGGVVPPVSPSTMVIPSEPPFSEMATATPETSSSVATTSAVSGWTVTPVVATSTTPRASSATAPAPTTRSFWSWFKFW